MAEELVGEGVTPIPSAATFLGCRDGGGQHLMPVSMGQLSLIWDTATLAMVPTTHSTDITDGSSH